MYRVALESIDFSRGRDVAVGWFAIAICESYEMAHGMIIVRDGKYWHCETASDVEFIDGKPELTNAQQFHIIAVPLDRLSRIEISIE